MQREFQRFPYEKRFWNNMRNWNNFQIEVVISIQLPSYFFLLKTRRFSNVFLQKGKHLGYTWRRWQTTESRTRAIWRPCWGLSLRFSGTFASFFREFPRKNSQARSPGSKGRPPRSRRVSFYCVFGVGGQEREPRLFVFRLWFIGRMCWGFEFVLSVRCFVVC